ncbi:hypothetical protein LJC31_03435 [Synergistaceae bacterium OttesenSCG-928-I11]|nr:hypothetical protein [Synergistaceae bacterium OttesenSCG-928-I11]
MERKLGFYNRESVGTIPARIALCDSTMRDGEQTAGVSFSIAERKEIARLLDDMGTPQIQLGFPGINKTIYDETKAICDLGLKAQLELMTRGTYDGWRDDVKAAIDCGADIVHTQIPMSSFMKRMYSLLSKEEILQRIADFASFSKEYGAKIRNVTLLDVPRVEIDFLKEAAILIAKSGVERMRLADTVGTSTPEGMFNIVSQVRNAIAPYNSNIEIALHCHNDFGFALANAFAGIKAGATLLDVSVNGLGERSGNPCYAEVVAAAEMMYGIKTGIDISRLNELSQLVAKLSGIPIPTNKPLVGELAFGATYDGHVSALIDDPFSYKGILPEEIGSEEKWLITKTANKTILSLKCKEYELPFDEETIFQHLLKAVQKKCDSKTPSIITDEEFIQLYHDTIK